MLMRSLTVMYTNTARLYQRPFKGVIETLQVYRQFASREVVRHKHLNGFVLPMCAAGSHQFVGQYNREILL